jgi:hypothetical protein
MLGSNMNRDPAARIHVTDHPNPSRAASRYYIVENPVGYLLVKHAYIPERAQVQFERLGFKALEIRDIADPDLGKVRLSRDGTPTRELRTTKIDDIITALVLVWKALQDSLLRSTGILLLASAEDGQLAQRIIWHRHTC